MKNYSPFDENGIESIYEDVYKIITASYAGASDKLVRGLENQKKSVNTAYDATAHNSYNNYIINNENLNAHLINAGLSETGMTESSAVASNAAYGAELREIEQGRKEDLYQIDSQIADIEYKLEKSAIDARDALNESNTDYLINKEAAQQNQEWNLEKMATKHQYNMDALDRKYAREDEVNAKNQANKLVMDFLNMGEVPDDELLTQADVSKEYAQTYADAVNEEKEKEKQKRKAQKVYYRISTSNEPELSPVQMSEKAQRLYNELARPTTNFESIKATLLSSIYTSLWDMDENGDSDANDILINLVANGVVTQAQANGIAFARKKQDGIDTSGMNSHTNSGRYNFLGNLNNILTAGEGGIAMIDKPYDLEAVYNAYNSLAEDVNNAINSPEYGDDFGVKFQKRIELLMPEVEKALNWIKANKELITNYEKLYNSFKGIKENLESFDGDLTAVREQMAEYDIAEDYYWSISSSEEISAQIKEVKQQEAEFEHNERYERIMAKLKKYDANYAEFEADAQWLKETLGVDVTYLIGKSAVLSEYGATDAEAAEYTSTAIEFDKALGMIEDAKEAKFDGQIEKLEDFQADAQNREEQAVLASEYNNITVVTATFYGAEADWGDGTLRGGDTYIKNMNATDRAIEAVVNGYAQTDSGDYQTGIEQIEREIEVASNYRYLYDQAMKNIETMIYGDAVINGYSDDDKKYIQNTFGIDLTDATDEQISHIINTLYGELNEKLHTVIDRVSWLESQKNSVEQSKKDVEINEFTLSYHSNENFDELSQYNQEYATSDNMTDDLLYIMLNRGLPDRYGTFKGGDEEYLDELKKRLREIVIGDIYTESDEDKYIKLQQKISEYEKYYLYMNDDEVATFNYIYATEGRDKAFAYLKKIERLMNKRETEEETAEAAEFAEDHPVLASVGSVFKSVGASVVSVVSNINDAVTVAMGGEIDPYSLLKLPQKEIDITRQVVSSNLGTVGAFLYNAGMSIADSGMRMAFTLGTGTALGLTGGALSAFTSVTSSVLSGSTVMQNAIDEALSKGYTDWGALAYGFAIGAVECLSEKAGIDRILEADGKFLARTLNNVVSEGSEEVVSNWGGRVINIIADGKNSEFALKLKEYRDAGASNKEALLKAVGDIAAEDAATFIAGGLSGFVMGEVHHKSNVALNYINKKSTGTQPMNFIESITQEITLDSKTAENIRSYLVSEGVKSADADSISSSIEHIISGTATQADIELVARNEHARSAMNNFAGTDFKSDGTVKNDIITYASGQRAKADYIGVINKKSDTDTNVKVNADAGLVRNKYVRKNLDIKVADKIDSIAKALGVKVHFVASVNGGKSNAAIDGSVIEIEQNNKNPLEYLLGHEITHRIKSLSPENYDNFKNAVINGMSEKFVDAQIKVMRAYGGKISDDLLVEETICNIAGEIALNNDLLESFIKQNRNDKGVLRAFLEVIQNIIDRFTGNDRRKMENAVYQLEKALGEAADAAGRLAQEGKFDSKNSIEYVGQKNNTEAGVKFSIKVDKNGNKIVVADNNILSGVKSGVHQVISNEIAKNIGQYYEVISDGEKVYIGTDLPGEYTQSKYTQYLLKYRRDLLKIKNKSSPYLGEMIEISTYDRFEKNKKDKHSVDARYGWYHYNTRLAIPIKHNNADIIRYDLFTVELLVRHDANGKKYLYDVVKIEEEGDKHLLPTDLQSSNHALEPSSKDNVSQNDTAVNSNSTVSEASKVADRLAQEGEIDSKDSIDGSSENGVKFSIKTADDGSLFVDVEESITDRSRSAKKITDISSLTQPSKNSPRGTKDISVNDNVSQNDTAVNNDSVRNSLKGSESIDAEQIYLGKEAQVENNSLFEGELGEATFMSGDEFVNTIKDNKLLLKHVTNHIAEKMGKNYIKNLRKMFDSYGDKYQAEEAVIKNYIGQVALDSDKTIDFVEFGIKNRGILVAYRDTLRNNIDRFNPRYRPQLNAALELTETVLQKMDDNLSNNVEISRNEIVDLYYEIYYNQNKKVDTGLYDETAVSEEDAYDENGRLKPDIICEAGERKYRYKTDSLGRIILAQARGLAKKLHEGRLSYVRETLEKLFSDDAGHIFADSFGGSGGHVNMFSQNRLVNRIEYVKLEAAWRKAINKGNTVNVEIELIYEGNSDRPAAMKIKYEIHEKTGKISYHEKTMVNYRLKE